MILKEQALSLIKSIYKMFIGADANMIEVNPLILTKDEKIICLDAKVNFDDNALFKHPEIFELRDLNEEDPIEIEASKARSCLHKIGWKYWLHGQWSWTSYGYYGYN